MKNNMLKATHIKRLYLCKKTKQKGMTLIIAMVMLLVITGVGVSAVKMSSTDTMVSGNSMLNMLTFQAAESTLVKIAGFSDLYDIAKSAESAVGDVHIVESNDASITAAYVDLKESIMDNKGTITSTATVTFTDDDAICPIATGFIYSNTQKCVKFEKDARSSTFGARAHHVEGVALTRPGS